MGDLAQLKADCEIFAKVHLKPCVTELLEWAGSGNLSDGKMRELADLCGPFVGRENQLCVASSLISRAALEAVALTAAQDAISRERNIMTAQERWTGRDLTLEGHFHIDHFRVQEVDELRALLSLLAQSRKAPAVEAVERAAEKVYARMPGTKTRPWQDGGISVKQSEARRYAEAVLASLPQSGWD